MKTNENKFLVYFKEMLALTALLGAIFLGFVNPDSYSETTKIVLVSTISGFFSISLPFREKKEKGRRDYID